MMATANLPSDRGGLPFLPKGTPRKFKSNAESEPFPEWMEDRLREIFKKKGALGRHKATDFIHMTKEEIRERFGDDA